MITLLRKALEEIGYAQIDEAPDGAIAWQKLQEANPPYDLILSDWNMPNLNGMDLLKKVRTAPKTMQTPFIMITTESERENILAALKAGATNYIIKPVHVENLRRKLEPLTKKKTASGADPATPSLSENPQPQKSRTMIIAASILIGAAALGLAYSWFG
jgi:two-component system, chemotaxis family, chemotaxis protein CheY